MQRARSETAKLEREDSILTATEILLRQSGYDSMTMQAVATAAGLAKGTLYLYFTSRESLVLAVYCRLFDRWIDRFAVSVLARCVGRIHVSTKQLTGSQFMQA